jgi:hypothetical protein
VYRGLYLGIYVAVKFAQMSIVDGLMQHGALETLQQVCLLQRMVHSVCVL